MADVRLTATNPEDSSVVPVACDAAGRLLLEEPVQGPPGPDGEQGPPGQDGQDGDPFSGNFAGDVTFGGSAEFAGRITGNADAVFEKRVFAGNAAASESQEIGVSAFGRFADSGTGSNGAIYAKQFSSTGNLFLGVDRNNKRVAMIKEDGSASFVGDVTFGGDASIANDVVIGKPVAVLNALRGVRIESAGPYNYLISNDVQAGGGTTTCYQHLLNGSQTLALNADGSAGFAGIVETEGTRGGFISGQVPVIASDEIWGVWSGKNYAGNTTSQIKGDGSSAFAGNKAGFTAEGYLWCTTRRGETVILDFTSNGAGQWIPYTPNTRLEDIRDKLDANRGDTGEMPADTP